MKKKHPDVYGEFYHEIFEKMEKHGGGFASQLARAFFRADIHNKRKIIENWGNLINQHLE